MNNLISVIVPVFKVERFLSRCIKSIQNQTYKNIEIILVDDGSPDCCPEICDAYAQMDSRIQVIHKKNGGLSDARNAGIEKANTSNKVSAISNTDNNFFFFIWSLTFPETVVSFTLGSL